MAQSGFKRLAVIGLGLIGGSWALACRRTGGAAQVTGWDTDPGVLSAAVAMGCIDRAAGSLADALAGADLVVLAAPPRAVLAMAPAVAEHVEPGALVTDTASTKRAVVARYEEALSGKAHFIGGHPMAGSERSGLGAARPDLFHGMPYALTPTPRTDPQALALLEALVAAMGARPAVLRAEDHDRKVAAVSHLPQLTVWAMVRAALGDQEGEAGDSPLQLAGSGWRDTVRLAGSPAAMWREVSMANADQIDYYLSRLAGEVALLRRLLAEGDEEGLERFFAGGRAWAGYGEENDHGHG